MEKQEKKQQNANTSCVNVLENSQLNAIGEQLWGDLVVRFQWKLSPLNHSQGLKSPKIGVFYGFKNPKNEIANFHICRESLQNEKNTHEITQICMVIEKSEKNIHGIQHKLKKNRQNDNFNSSFLGAADKCLNDFRFIPSVLRRKLRNMDYLGVGIK